MAQITCPKQILTHRGVFLVVLLLASQANHANGITFEFVKIADTNTPIPGGTGAFRIVGLPAISDGVVAFRGLGFTFQQGIYTRSIDDPGSLAVLYDTGTAIPGGTGNFAFFGNPAFDHGRVAFRGGSDEQLGIYTDAGGTLRVVADLTTAIPDGTGNFTEFSNPWLCDGDVVFRALGLGGQDGIYTTAGGSLRAVADTNTPIPGGTGNFTSFGFVNVNGVLFGVPAMDGTIVFRGSGAGQKGVYKEVGGSLEVVADLNTPIPGGTGNFTDFERSVLAGNIVDDTLVFVGEGSGGQIGLYLNREDSLSVVVDGNSVVPGTTETFTSIAAQGMGFDNGYVSFLADGPPQQGVYTTLRGSLTKVAANLDVLEGRTILALGTYGQGLEGNHIAFNVGNFGGANSIANFVAIAVVPRVDISTKGSALIYSKVDLRWDAAGNLRQDTILEISNDYPEDVYIQMYFVNGDAPRDPVFALDPPVMVAEGEPGWNWVDCQTLLTANQPKYWSASSGSPLGCQPFTILDSSTGDGPGRLDPDSQDGGRVLRGYLLAWAVDAQGHPIRWNHLSGAATIVNYGAQAAWEYNAWAAQHGASSTSNNQVGGPGHLSFDGIAYDAGFDVLLMDFYASGSTALSGGGFIVSSDTDLTLHPISADLRQDSGGPLTTKAHFDIWNGNEFRFSGTHRCITCWDQTLLSRYDVPNHFLRGFLGTDTGKARIDGQRSDVCDDDCVRADLDETGTDWGVCSYDASLIGVVARVLEFNGPVTGRRAMSGRSIVGAGTQSAKILYDIIAPPGELRDDAYEAMGGLYNDAPVRIGNRKKTNSRGANRK